MSEVNFWKEIYPSKIRVYRSPNIIKLQPPVEAGPDARWYPAYRVRCENLTPDEVLSIIGTVEVTNGNPYLVECAWRIVINDDYNDSPGENGAFLIGAGGGVNVSNSRHHETCIRPIHWIPDQNYAEKNITFMIRLKNQQYGDQGDYCVTTQASCDLTVLRFMP